jgi:EipB-like
MNKISILPMILALVWTAKPVEAAAVGFDVLAPHRAIYDLKLGEASERSGIQSITGRIVYEITGNACEGMAVRYRFVTNIVTSENSYQTDQQTTTFESPDGKEFDFLTRTFVDAHPEKTIRGTAMRTGDGLEIELTNPDERHLELPDAIFISTHLTELIDKAREGERFVHHSIYDGSEDADEVVTGSGVIGEAATYSKTLPGEKEAALAPLEGMKAWPVTVSYFEKAADASAESLPVYEASFLLYPNGVSRKLIMRYDDYALVGNLTGLEMLEETGCNK